MGKRKNKGAIAEVSLFPEGALAPIHRPEDEINVVEVVERFSADNLEALRLAQNDDEIVKALAELLNIDNGSDLENCDLPPLFIRKLWAINANFTAKRHAAKNYMIAKLMEWKWTQDGLNPVYISEWSDNLLETYNNYFMQYSKTGDAVIDAHTGSVIYGKVMEAVANKRPCGKAVFKAGTSQGELHRLANGEEKDPDKEVHWHPGKVVADHG